MKAQLALGMVIGFSGCTQQLASQFLLTQQQQAFNSHMDINTKVDLLWVVDNSASMDIEQQRLRDAFSAFAQKYMQPTWDIRVAAITTDTYLADPAYSTYLNTVIPGTVNYNSSYITSRLSTFVNPPNNPTLVNLTNGNFTNGIMYKDLMPAWGMSYGRLLPGLHDGPIAALCINNVLPYFFAGVTDCAVRDDQSAYNGTADCLNPTGSQSSESQCVNTLENNTVRTGQPIIETIPPVGTAGDQTWINGLINNFVVDLTTGSAGHGSERGIQSVLQLLKDNEGTSTAFFRPGSLRAIMFLSDEDDQTMDTTGAPAGLTPWNYYSCDQAGLVALNGSGAGQAGGYCCSGGQCTFGSYGTSCTPKTVDGYTYTISICPDPTKLMPLATAKGKIDSFFQTLDASGTAGNPNYFVFSIVALGGNSIQALQTARYSDDSAAGAYKVTAVDEADRYIGLGNLVGNGSQAMDISSTDYSQILTTIGNTIIQKKGTFTLTYAPSGGETMTVTVQHANGTSTIIPSTSYTVSGNTLTITDLNVVLGFQSTDQIVINYQPSTSVAS